MQTLALHPDCAPGSIHSITADIVPTATGCRAAFVASGDVTRIAVPAIDSPGRFDNLWKTTCFEIFWSHDGTSYREFNLSHTAALPGHNQVVAGVWVPGQMDGLSIEEGIARTLGLKLGDRLRFDLAGLTVQGTVTSIRRVEWTSMRANFFVLFPRAQMPDVPMSYMTAYRSPDGPGLDRRLLAQFPNITQVDLSATLNQVQSVLTQVSQAVECLFLFALASGWVVLIAVVVLTREERARDQAVLRALGASRRVLSRLQSAELLGTGALAGGLAAVTALAVAWALAREVFDFAWALPWWVVPMGVAMGAAMAAGVGGWTLRAVMRQSVTQTLRQSEP